MPLTDISEIKCKIFGISFLPEEENNRVLKQWKANFSSRTAFWVEGSEETPITSVAQEVCTIIQKEGFHRFDGEKVVLAYFLDFTQAISKERIKEMAALPGLLAHALACKIYVTLQFGFVGKLAFANAAVQRANAMQVVAQNIEAEKTGSRRQLCLVASPTLELEGGHNWKAVALFLDLLRRQTDPTTLLPGTGDFKTNNDVGFLSYAEHSETQKVRLEQQKEHLTELLGEGGGANLQQAIAERLAVLERTIDEKYHIDAAAFPQHPSVQVVNTTVFSNNQRRASRGNYEPYNVARNAISTALIETANDMEAALIADAKLRNKDARHDLSEMIDQNAVGLGLLEQKKQMLGYLDVQFDKHSKPMPPTLQYQQEGLVSEIAKYLEETLAYIISKCKETYIEALKAAYQDMEKEGFAKRREDYSWKVDQIRQKLAGMCDAKTFYIDAITGVPSVHADFHPYLPNGSSLLSVIVRGDAMLNIANSNDGVYTKTRCFSMNEQICGTPELDDAQMKVLSIMFKDCDEQNLLDLIPEVTQ